MDALLRSLEAALAPTKAYLPLPVSLFLIFFSAMMVLRPLVTFGSKTILKKLAHIEKPEQVRKVGDAFWFWLYYTCAFSFATYALWGKPYVWNMEALFANHPSPPAFENLVFLMFELGAYSSAFCYLFIEIRKSHKDFWMMLVHHIASIFLISVGTYFQYDRLATVSLWLHDVADIFLEGAKVLNYCGFKVLRYIPFGLLVPAWGVPRLFYFPYHIIRGSFIVYLHERQNYPLIEFFLVFMSVMWCLDLGWYLMILNMVKKGLCEKKLEKDVRSDSDSDAEPEKKKK